MLNWSEIKTVLLDMDGTLLDLHFDNFFWLEYLPQVYSSTFDITHADAIDYLHKRFADEQGTMSWYCLDYWTEQLQIDIAGLKKDVEVKIAIRPFVEPFLQALKQQGKQIILVTNAHRDSLNLKMQRTQLQDYFDVMVSSHDYGVPKEQQTLWEALQADYHFELEHTLLIDDTETVLASAENFGIRHLLTINQPDLQKPPRVGLKYPAISHFDEIMPCDR
jgi:putative hydrolase of the HAD superfamily